MLKIRLLKGRAVYIITDKEREKIWHEYLNVRCAQDPLVGYVDSMVKSMSDDTWKTYTESMITNVAKTCDKVKSSADKIASTLGLRVCNKGSFFFHTQVSKTADILLSAEKTDSMMRSWSCSVSIFLKGDSKQ